MLLLHEMNRKKINQEIIKRKERKKYKQERRDSSSITLSLFFWMFLWIIDDYPGIGWILLMVVRERISRSTSW
jgi:hypothetical protein